MKYRAFAIIIFLLGTYTLTPRAHAGPVMTEKAARVPAYQEKGARDVSQNAWSSWEAPVSTVDPSQLVSDDSTDSTSSDGLPAQRLDSPKANAFQLAGDFNGGTPVKVEETKPIQMVESGDAKPSNAQPVPTVAVVAPKNSSNRILLIAVVSVAILAYRKFRRVGPYPRKPSFL